MTEFYIFLLTNLKTCRVGLLHRSKLQINSASGHESLINITHGAKILPRLN